VRNTLKELELLIRSRYPLVYLLSFEEGRVVRTLGRLAKRLNKRVYFWSCSEGWDHTDLAGDDTRDPAAALLKVLQSSERALFVLKDFHPFLDSERHPQLVRRLRDIVAELRSSYKSVIVLSPVLKVPPEMEKDITVVDIPLPDPPELGKILTQLLDSVRGDQRFRVDEDPDLRERVIQAALGLTETEAENVFAKALVHQATFSAEDLPLVLEEKRQILRKSGLLEYVDVGEGLEDVGGIEVLKEWLQARGNAFSEAATAYGLPPPKGVLLLGVQGCGKSLCCKAVASLWKMPLLRMDVGALFNPFVGSSEMNMRRAIQVAESLAPAVLWLDEIEKGFAGLKSSGQVDAGVTARVFATFLTWLQEKTKPVFVTATANAIHDLPPELLRKGRFDEIFFVDLPNADERREIFRIHLKKRKREPERFEVERLVGSSLGYSGAEIEQGILAALYATFPEGRDIETGDVLRALEETVPLSRTMAEQIDALRRWAAQRAKPASLPEDGAPATPGV
jgi:AAA+ superfamily predicted ATPase